MPRGAWKPVYRRLVELGVKGATTAKNEAIENQVAPESVLALCDEFGKRRREFDDAVVLYNRVMAARPGQPIDDLWPRPTERYKREHRRELQQSADQEKKAKEAAEKRERAESERRAAEQERRFGPLLDSLPAELLEPHVPEHLMRFWRQSRQQSSHVRIVLLDKLERGEISIAANHSGKPREREPRDPDEELP